MASIWIEKHSIPLIAGQTLFEHADRMGVRIPASCNRDGSCHACMVHVSEGAGMLSERSPEERFLRGGYRLACQCRVERTDHDVHIRMLRRGRLQIAAEGCSSVQILDPWVRRGADGTVMVDGRPAGRTHGPLLGLAADLGTTTVVLRLMNLDTGHMLATHSFENPQMFAGADVLSRIAYDGNVAHGELQRILVAYLNHTIDTFLDSLGYRSEHIYALVVAGNPTMRDLFFGLNVQGIGHRPFQSESERLWRAGERPGSELIERPHRLGLHMNKHGIIHGLPVIASHVGADTAAALATLGMDRLERPVMLMDLGTNSELVIGYRDRAICASSPAGPAFEGGSIACGMPGLEGAIQHVSINGQTVQLDTIGGGEPLGICGSGLVDALGELLRTGNINMVGRINAADGRFWFDRDRDLYLCDRDISELAQAKAATMAGASILLEAFGISLDDLDRFYLAGGFARYIDERQAMRIGMIPRMPVEKVEKIGNASIEGATAILCSSELRERIHRFAQRIEHIELERHPDFFGIFVEGCQFKPFTHLQGRG